MVRLTLNRSSTDAGMRSWRSLRARLLLRLVPRFKTPGSLQNKLIARLGLTLKTLATSLTVKRGSSRLIEMNTQSRRNLKLSFS